MTSPMDEALRRTNEAVERYDVPNKKIGIAAESLERMPAELRHDTEVYAMADAISELAAAHRGRHEGCVTCTSLENALAVAMASVRAETDIALRAMISE
jgi:hypothetical protein